MASRRALARSTVSCVIGDGAREIMEGGGAGGLMGEGRVKGDTGATRGARGITGDQESEGESLSRELLIPSSQSGRSSEGVQGRASEENAI